jgi:glycine/D-amino acid oxidase-like deaminating enzyme
VRTAGAYWLLRNGIGDAGETLTQSCDCDIAIVGSGITATLIADRLVGTGQRIVMLESRDVAQGSTAASTALLQYEIDTHLTELCQLIGTERAMRAYQACAESIPMLERLYPELMGHADFERRESLYLAEDDEAVPALRMEVAARRGMGLSCEWLDGDTVRRRFGCQRPGAILSSLGAQMDPLRLTRGLVAGLLRHGVKIHARTKVVELVEQGDRLALRTDSGHVVTAGQVVIAAGYESLAFLPREVANIDNTFALVTEPLARPARAHSLPLIWESARPYAYLRGTPDGRIILGGADVPFSNPVARDALLPRQVRRLAVTYEELFGEPLPSIAYAWAGSFASTRDGLPYIGQVPGMNPRLQFALCYGGNGISFSVHAGDMIRAGIEGRGHALDDIFGFSRLGPGLADK